MRIRRRRFGVPGRFSATVGPFVLAVVVVAAAGAGRTASLRATGHTSGNAAAPVAQPYPAAGNDWLNGGGDLANSRYSSLNQINTSNVSKLKVVWSQTLDTPDTAGTKGVQGLESTPSEANGVLYAPMANGLRAFNAVSGKVKWTYTSTVPMVPAFGLFAGGNPSRHIAIGDGLVFVGVQDGSVVALNQQTGAQVWVAQVASAGTYSSTVREANSFTVYANGVVLTGTNGGDTALQGSIAAYDAKTGALLWRWFTTPDPTSLPFILTWSNPAEAATGGAAVWSTPAVDTKLNRVYVATGNAHANLSPGKNLWTTSIASLDLKTGALKWYFQGVHHDQWDYDCPTPPVLYNAAVGGKTVPAVAYTCKPAYIFLLDRRNGHPLIPTTEVNVPNPGNQPLKNQWPTQPETTGGSAEIIAHCATTAQIAAAAPSSPTTAPNGKPYVATCPYAVADPATQAVWGGAIEGGANWPPSSFDPQTNDLLICAGYTFNGVGSAFATAGPSGTVSALNVTTNKLDWQVVWQANKDGGCYSGLLSTAGGLVFVGSRGQPLPLPGVTVTPGTFYAYDAKTGKTLFSYPNVTEIDAPAMTYSVGGKQYIAICLTQSVVPGYTANATGNTVTVFALP